MSSESENSRVLARTRLVGRYGGESRAENAGVRVLIVHALSGVGSRCVVRDSYAYEKSSVSRVK
jgi:hypothetical protein